jgi:hypothetical protein
VLPPGQQLYLDEADPLQTADFVVDDDDPAAPRLVSPGRALGTVPVREM